MKISLTLSCCLALVLCLQCDTPSVNTQNSAQANDYLDYSSMQDKLSGGVSMIPVKTQKGIYKVWTKRVGNNPTIKVLLLHGGPGFTHEYFECCDSYFPHAGVEYYYYDQLGSYYSDQPGDSTLWDLDRYVDEVEQVRIALGLDSTNFYLMGHSWGGILALEYALKYQQNLKGLIISNMVASIPGYNKYAEEVLGPQLPPEVLQEVKDLEARQDYANPRYMELLVPYYYEEHILRMPAETWPDPVNRAFAHHNNGLYVTMQGPSEFGCVGNARLKDWDRTADLPQVNVPTLTIGGANDTMDPEHMKWMSKQVKHGRYLHCPKGSHMSMYDDQEVYFSGVIKFVRDVDEGKF